MCLKVFKVCGMFFFVVHFEEYKAKDDLPSHQFSTTSILIINTLQQLKTPKLISKCFETTRGCRYTTFSGLSFVRLRMAATISSKKSRNYKYPYFDPITHDWNIDTTRIKNFQFVNYINKSHNQTNTLYLIFDVIPKLNQNHILPFTYSNNLAILNDNLKFSLENLIPQYLSNANHLKDVFVSIIDINKLINIFGKDNFKNIEIYHQQLDKIDKANQNKHTKETNKTNISNKKIDNIQQKITITIKKRKM